ncbi:MAG: hypothetical protein V2J12_01455 [Gammaproteobacteria bacterium]|jgi:hypothetical protein|nr:hypothetical protein [Gammaproteobacteria bacterium]
MTQPLAVVAVLAVVFIAYVAAKVYAANRQSQRDWENTDKTRLKTWQDEDDWDQTGRGD